MHSSSISARCVLVVLLIAAAGAAAGENYAPYPQPDAGYVTDLAGVLSEKEEERIEQWLIRVEQRSKSEIIVVTIDSIQNYPGTNNSSIETFATGLFNTWKIGNKAQNNGILLLVAVKDRKARIELGAGFSGSGDAVAAGIMNDTIVPQFRKGNYPGGITDGVKAIVNTLTTARIGVPWRLVAMGVTSAILLMAGVSLLLNGKRGWGWVVIGLALVLLIAAVYILINIAKSGRGRSSSWSAGGLGGFGGGFSSGGGATGSW